MDRRSFMLALFGGSIAASAGAALTLSPAQAAEPAPVPGVPDTVDPAVAEALDSNDAEYAQYYRRGPRRRGPPHARGWGPPRYRHRRRGPPPGYYRRRRYYRRNRW